MGEKQHSCGWRENKNEINLLSQTEIKFRLFLPLPPPPPFYILHFIPTSRIWKIFSEFLLFFYRSSTEQIFSFHIYTNTYLFSSFSSVPMSRNVRWWMFPKDSENDKLGDEIRSGTWEEIEEAALEADTDMM